MANNCIKRSLYRTRGMVMESFMYEPRVEVGYNDINKVNKTFSVEYNTIIMIRATEDSKGSFNYAKNNYFKITMKNYYRVIKFFNKILKWFFDPDKNDLYYELDGHLCFNNDYNDLNEKIKDGTIDIQRMSAIPTVIVYQNSEYEGILLYINDTSNVIQLTINQLQEVFGILQYFNFQQEAILLSTALIQGLSGNFTVRDNPWGNNNVSNKGGQIKWH